MRPLFLFAPGAGAPSTSAWMRAWARRLATLGKVVTLDYEYTRAGRKLPDRLPSLVAAHRAALARASKRHAGAVWLVGKSMGSRVGCHLALEEPVDGLVCLGYPLRSTSGKLRDEVLLALARPILFVQGTRDPLCPLDVLADVRRRMRAPNTLHVVDGGDHSLVTSAAHRKASHTTQADSDARVLAAVRAFVEVVR